ncbi:Crotonyl-CoA reductase [Actinomadura rubteroloni]|uniref:Crotonyl-CoA reductase n=1 Tax=Actinomadura rubteroloni TaxID=1926885 RepID=A0A2P4UL90_9ACTN|nr:zinc-binding dehydrogenase [Actinomadura rubteroloni]POM25759.1 Crotonyl-CoA reductase [Actinomadura rubteroloni]
MRAIRRTAPDPDGLLDGIEIADHDAPPPPPGWTTVALKAASVNYSDLMALRGFGFDPSGPPRVLGSDGAGIDRDGNEVIVYPIVAAPGHGDPLHDPGLRMLSQGIDGTWAESVHVPSANLVPKPPELSWEQAACLGTAWLTAYRMLFGRADLKPGETVLVQGAGGGVPTALIRLGVAAGLRVWVAARDRERGRRAVDELGARAAFPAGTPVPEPVDAALDCVGAATLAHSLRSIRPGGRLVTAGAVTGATVELDLADLFVRSISVHGSAMGSPAELRRLARHCAATGAGPVIDGVWPLTGARPGLARALAGEGFGKIVLRCDR